MVKLGTSIFNNGGTDMFNATFQAEVALQSYY